MVAIVVGAAVVVAILFAAGFLFHKAAAPGSTQPYSTLDEAESVAVPAASHAVTGSWSPAVAIGLHLAGTISLPVANLSGLSGLTDGCSLTTLSGAPSAVTVNATPVASPPGEDAFWLIGLTNGQGAIAFVSVGLGIPSPLYSVSASSSCHLPIGDVAAFPSSEADSPALVGAVNASGGYAFLIDHPSAAQVLLGIGGGSYDGLTSPPLWEAVDTSCPLPLIVNESGAEFNASLFGTPSIIAHSSGPVNCAAGLGSSLSGLSLAGPLLGVGKAI